MSVGGKGRHGSGGRAVTMETGGLALGGVVAAPGLVRRPAWVTVACRLTIILAGQGGPRG